MRPDIVPGARFPDYVLPDHTSTPRRIGELQGQTTTTRGRSSVLRLALRGRRLATVADRYSSTTRSIFGTATPSAVSS